MMLRDCFEHFREACDELLRLGAEENALLRSNQALNETFLDRKRGALHQLDRALQDLRGIPATEVNAGKGSSAKELKAIVQQKLMQLLLLDRENEQLLLRTSLRTNSRALPMHPSAEKVTSLYEQFASR